MKQILRSMIVCDPSDDGVFFRQNFFLFKDAGLPFIIPEHQEIWEFVNRFIVSYGNAPQMSTIISVFEREGNDAVVDQLSLLKLAKPLVQGDFHLEIERLAEQRRVRQTEELLDYARNINATGLQIGEGKDQKIWKGPQDACRFVMQNAHDILKPTFGSRLYGVVNEDMAGFVEEYENARDNPESGIGMTTGIMQIDEALQGLRRYELWTHAAFTGHLKTTLALNWIYNQAVYFGNDSYYYSLEMPYEQVRRILVAMHSFHDKFEKVRAQLGIKDGCLDYNYIKTGRLAGELTTMMCKDCGEEFSQGDECPHCDSEDVAPTNPSKPDQSGEHERFLLEYVTADFEDPRNHYGRIHVEAGDPDKDDITIADIRARAEMVYSQSPFGMMVIDHLLLVAPRGRHSSTTERLNEVVRDAKKMALSFNRGEGMGVLALYQLSREGYKYAEKNEGRYNLTHLSYSNEIERSSDIVTTTWITDEMKKQCMVQFQCLKSRDQAPFDIFKARVEWKCRRLLTCLLEGDAHEVNKVDDELDVDNLLDDVEDITAQAQVG